MKNKLLTILTSILLASLCLFTLTACEEPHSHTYVQAVTQPTCTEQGYTTNTCECGDSYVDNYVDELGHSFTNYISDNNATYDNDGTKTAKCDNCDVTDTIVDEGSKLLPTDDFAFNFDNGIITGLTNYGKTLTEIIIPSKINNATVTSIGENAFKNYNPLTSIVIPDSVTSIGNYAFYDCDFLTSVTMGNNVKNIGDNAFCNCLRLTSIEIPNSVKNIGDNAFCNCVSLTSVTIGNNVASIGNSAFYNCDSLTSVTIGNNVASIGNSAFYSCDLLTSVTIGNSVTSIGNNAFYGCFSLIEVYNKSRLNIVKDSSSYGYVGYYALNVYTQEGGSKLSTDSGVYVVYTGGSDKILVDYNGTETDLILPNGITEIYMCAFCNCSSLTSIEIPNSVKNIGDKAFYNCNLLTSVTIGNNVTSIGDYAFGDCYKLVEVINNSSYITVKRGSEDNGYLGYYALSVSNCDSSYVTKVSTDSDGYIIYADGEDKILVNYLGGQTDIILPSGITKIYQRTFYYNNKITSIEIPNSVTSIGDEVFRGCSSLTSIEIGNSVISIGDNAFDRCNSLTSIEIPDSVTSIGTYAFRDCSSLTSIEIPDSLTSVGSYVFEYCTSLTYNIKGELKYLGNKNNPYLYLVDTANTNIVSADIDKNCKFIGDYVFEGCDSLTSIVIPDSVTSIGSCAFRHCDSLTSVTIGNGVTSIGGSAFYDCDSLTSITFSDTSTWYRTQVYDDWQNKTNGIQKSVMNSTSNATYFKSTYYNYYWYKI